MVTKFNLDSAKVQAAREEEFQNVFDFPDFIEMRPILREAVREVAKESFAGKAQVLPVKIERMTTALEEQLERETRKYEHQGGVYPNQTKEKAELIRLFTHVLQVISKREVIDEEIEDIIYAVNQTRLSLIHLPSLEGTGKLYADDRDEELLPGTFYYLVAQQLVQPYLIDPQGPFAPTNVTKEGRHLVLKLTTYAFRDWDSYLTHQYDEEHALANERGLNRKEYYDRMEELELKYADHKYAEVLADLFTAVSRFLEPDAGKEIGIMTTDLSSLFNKQPLLRLKFQQAVKDAFQLDENGREHVMDAVLADIHHKYDFYRANFTEED